MSYYLDNRRHEGGDVNDIRHPEDVFEIPRHGIVPSRTELEMIYNYCQDTIQYSTRSQPAQPE